MHKFLLGFLIFWLPTQSIAIAFTPHCAHQNNTHDKFSISVELITENSQLDVDHVQLMDSNTTVYQHCETNSLCHVNCGSLLAATLFTNNFLSDASFYALLNINTVGFIPDLPQHPPRA